MIKVTAGVPTCRMTLTASDPDHAEQMLRMAIWAALDVMTGYEVRQYCSDFIDRTESLNV